MRNPKRRSLSLSYPRRDSRTRIAPRDSSLSATQITRNSGDNKISPTAAVSRSNTRLAAHLESMDADCRSNGAGLPSIAGVGLESLTARTRLSMTRHRPHVVDATHSLKCEQKTCQMRRKYLAQGPGGARTSVVVKIPHHIGDYIDSGRRVCRQDPARDEAGRRFCRNHNLRGLVPLFDNGRIRDAAS